MIERAGTLTPAEFRDRFVRPQKPVLLAGLARHWPAVAKWSPAWFRREIPDVVVPYEEWYGTADDAFDYDSRHVTRYARMDEFVGLLERRSGRELYSTMFRVFEKLPHLARDIEPVVETMIPLWPAPLRRLLTLAPNLWTGPAGTVSVLHFDRVHNLYVQIHGRKKWVLISPRRSVEVYWPCDDLRVGMLQFSPVDAEHPNLARYPRFADADAVEVILEPGDVLFVPTGWWHQVRSLDVSVSLNFFWIAPFGSPLALRRYYAHLLRRALRPTAA